MVAMARRIAHLALACVAMTSLVIAQNSGTARIAGRVVSPDVDASPLPGVTVTAVMGPVRLSAVTDANGRFELPNLRTGVYTVTAELHGFETYTRDVVLTAPGTLDVDITLRVGCLREILIVDFGVRAALTRADAIAYVRIVDSLGSRRLTWERDCIHAYEYLAEVIDVVKAPSGALPTPISFFMQESRVYSPGQEFIVLLARGPSGSVTRQAAVLEFFYSFPIQDGRVRWHPDLPDVKDGDSVQHVMQALRAHLQ